jgi:hypothetical protein
MSSPTARPLRPPSPTRDFRSPARGFPSASERAYRRVSFDTIAIARLIGMPLLDRWLR